MSIINFKKCQKVAWLYLKCGSKFIDKASQRFWILRRECHSVIVPNSSIVSVILSLTQDLLLSALVIIWAHLQAELAGLLSYG